MRWFLSNANPIKRTSNGARQEADVDGLRLNDLVARLAMRRRIRAAWKRLPP